jgi:hypothetical protein
VTLKLFIGVLPPLFHLNLITSQGPHFQIQV